VVREGKLGNGTLIGNLGKPRESAKTEGRERGIEEKISSQSEFPPN
jgi:hypothetical protein